MSNRKQRRATNKLAANFKKKVAIAKSQKKSEAVRVEASGYYLSNPKYEAMHVLMLLGRNPNFNGILIEGKPEDFEGEHEREVFRYIEQDLDLALDGSQNMKMFNLQNEIMKQRIAQKASADLA